MGQKNYESRQAALNFLPDFCDFLAMPCDANNPPELEANIEWCEQQFSQRGFTVKHLPTAGIEVLLATYEVDADLPEVLFYVQIDGQPVDASRWANGAPYTPMLGKPTEEGYTFLEELPTDFANVDPSYRLFSRAASDAKGPIAMFLAAWDHMQQKGRQPAYNVKVIMDTEEELGSPNLPPVVIAEREALSADHFVILDGPPHISNPPTLVFGARGIATARITVYGPRVPLHSGHYGNYAPNPALRMAQLLASMKNDAGVVTIPYWYDGITLSESVKNTLAAVPDKLEEINHKLGFAAPDQVGGSLQEAIQYPSLNVRGLSSGWVGAAVRTIIPANAVANLDIRLVKESDPERLMELLQAHIRAQGYYLITDGREPTDEERDQYPRIASFAYKETKYFCLTEAIANYLQKFIVYRKRKVSVGKRLIQDLSAQFKKNKDEKFLLPCSNLGAKSVCNYLDELGLDWTDAMMYRTVSSDLSDLSDVTYDILVFFSPLGITSLYENFPDFKQNDTRLAVFGSSTTQAVEERGLQVNIRVQPPEVPSMTKALEIYLKQSNPDI
eukprot:g543.t1